MKKKEKEMEWKEERECRYGKLPISTPSTHFTSSFPLSLPLPFISNLPFPSPPFLHSITLPSYSHISIPFVTSSISSIFPFMSIQVLHSSRSRLSQPVHRIALTCISFYNSISLLLQHLSLYIYIRSGITSLQLASFPALSLSSLPCISSFSYISPSISPPPQPSSVSISPSITSLQLSSFPAIHSIASPPSLASPLSRPDVKRIEAGCVSAVVIQT